MSRLARIFAPTQHKVMALTVLLGFGVLFLGVAPKVHANQDCDNNAIIYCGFTSTNPNDAQSMASSFISKVRSNSSGNGHNDLQAIYNYYNLPTSQYDSFAKNAVLGTDNRDGTIVVNGQVVATNADSIGRLSANQGSGSFSKTISGGGTYYGNQNSKAFAATSNSIPVLVSFDGKGVMQFGVLSACGNPVGATKVSPQYSCKAIHKAAVTGKANTYDFTAEAGTLVNATIVSYNYDFGDGSPVVHEPNGTTVVEHTYDKAKTYTASVTITVSLPGGATQTTAPCSTTITVVAPFYNCVELTGAILDKTKNSYSFTVTANFGNGATFTGADFNFGDGSKPSNDVKPNGGSTSVTVLHTYATAGNYRATATLHFGAYDDTMVSSCYASVTPTQPPTPECQPGIPAGSALCSPCKYNSSIPSSDTVHCVPPTTTLPDTGAGDVIAVFGAAVVAGFIFFRQFIYKRSATASSNAVASSIGHHMLSGAAQPDHSQEMVHHLTHNGHHQVDRPHPNTAKALHHPTYHRANRFRPDQKHHDK